MLTIYSYYDVNLSDGTNLGVAINVCLSYEMIKKLIISSWSLEFIHLYTI